MSEDYDDEDEHWDEEDEYWDDEDEEEENNVYADVPSGPMNTLDDVRLQARAQLGDGIKNPIIHPLSQNGFFLWRTEGSMIWHLQCVGLMSRFGRVIIEGDSAGISRTTFEVPIEQEVGKLSARPSFDEITTETFGSYYLNDAWFIAKMIETDFAKQVKQVTDSIIDNFVPKRTYYALYSKVANRMFHPAVKTVPVKFKILETGEVADGELPIDEIRELNLPEWSE